MKIFVYEFVTGGGWYAMPGQPPASLLAEGTAIRNALAEDFSKIPNVQVAVLRDERFTFPSELPLREIDVRSALAAEEAFETLAAECDWTVVVAPELSNRLLHFCQTVQQVGGRLLGPGLEAVAIASDKHATVQWLAARGVPVPEGKRVQTGDAPCGLPFPLVVKPCFGAGSHGVRLAPDAAALEKALASMDPPWRVERFVPGLAASVAFLCGPATIVPLVPCRQLLSDDGALCYLGGELPLAPPLADRAERLARRAIETLPALSGFVGVDLVLGGDPSGSGDVVIEVNPRPTTSYIGLRQAAEGNLAQAMLDAATGKNPNLRFRPTRIQFSAA